jgi:hypothetical protein
MNPTSEKPKIKNTAKGEQIYYVPVAECLNRKAKVKISAASPKEAKARARALVANLGINTVMTACATQSTSMVSVGQPWQPETIEFGATPPVVKISPR